MEKLAVKSQSDLAKLEQSRYNLYSNYIFSHKLFFVNSLILLEFPLGN